MGDAVLGPLHHPEHQVAFRIRGVAGLHDLAEPAAHDVAHLDAGHVGVDAVHPHPDGRVERQVQRAHERFAVGGLGDALVDEIEVVVLERTVGM